MLVLWIGGLPIRIHYFGAQIRIYYSGVQILEACQSAYISLGHRLCIHYFGAQIRIYYSGAQILEACQSAYIILGHRLHIHYLAVLPSRVCRYQLHHAQLNLPHSTSIRNLLVRNSLTLHPENYSYQLHT